MVTKGIVSEELSRRDIRSAWPTAIDPGEGLSGHIDLRSDAHFVRQRDHFVLAPPQYPFAQVPACFGGTGVNVREVAEGWKVLRLSADNIDGRKVSVRLGPLMVFILIMISALFDAMAFDCSKAVSPTEKRICADPSLAQIDHEMGALYRNVIQKAKNVAAWKADQRAWLVERDRCEDDGCLRWKYRERLVILRATEPPAQWAGHWWRVDTNGMNRSKLVITHARPNSVSFDLSASAGGNTGELAGKATLDASNTARYKGTAQSDTEGCSLVFRRVLNRLNIEGDEASCGAGEGVYYSGTYVASDTNPNTTPDLLSLGVLQTTAQDNALRKLLRKDYDTMVATADMVDDHMDNLDGNGATVVSMAVRGIACNTKSVLMFDGKGHQWAAVWEPLSAPENIVELRYYTNVISDKHTLPKTISAEREACGETVRVRMMP